MASLRHFLRTGALLIGFSLCAWAGDSRADDLDTVLDILAKAGVIDGNVKAAKPLIFCLADGKSVEACTVGAAEQSELAQDPQVRNVIDIYLAYRQQDWYGLVKRAGVTVGCALIPGGEVKDILCGELGKVALSIVNGVGDVMSGIASGLSSLACGIFGGCSEDLPPPMPAEDHYRLYFAPTYHGLLMAKDAEDGSYQARLKALNMQCQDFYVSQYGTDNSACTSNSIKLKRTVDLLYQALRDEGDSQYALRIEPKLEAWAYANFGQDSSAWVDEQSQQCRKDVVKAIPMPDPYGRCDYIAEQGKQYAGSMIGGAMAKLQQQCIDEMKPYAVAAPQDIYALACEPVRKKTPVAVLAAMNVWKQRMNKAEAARCANSGTPASVSCPDFDRFVACNQAVAEKRSICGSDRNGWIAQGVYEKLSAESANAGKPSRCERVQNEVRCARPVKAQGCRNYMTLYGDQLGVSDAAQTQCVEQQDAEYAQKRQLADQVVAALNGDAPSGEAAPRTSRGEPQPAIAAIRPASGLVLKPGLVRALRVNNPGDCRVEAPDWLRIRCVSGFTWDADAERAQSVTQLLGQPLTICANDPELDGADAPCLDGIPVAAFPGQAP